LKPINLSFKTLRRIAIALLLAAWCVALTGCGDSTTVPPPRAATITYDEQLLIYKVEFDLTAASHREMGRQYAQAIVENFPQFERLTDAFLESTLKEVNMTFTKALENANVLKKNIPQEYLDEIEGMGLVFSYPSDEIGNGRLSPNKIFLSVIFQDATENTGACSASAVFGASSATGGTIVGRNNDWNPNPNMDTWNALFIFHNGNKSVVGNGMIGELFPNNVFNRHHVFAAALDSSPAMVPSLPISGTRSPTVDIRYAMETCHTLADAEKFLSENKYALGSLTLMADAETAHILEYDISRPEGQRGRIRLATSALIDGVSWSVPNAIASVNSYLLPGSFINHIGDAHNTLRFINFQQLFSAVTEGPLGVKQMQGIMGYTSWDGNAGTSGAIFRLESGVATFQSLIVRLDTFETWIAYSAHGAPWPYTPVYYKVLDGDPFRK
jgi:hypothetical protein